MNQLNRIVLTCITLSMALVVGAIPARKGEIRVLQPDGSQLTIHTIGDEHTHYTLTDDNKLLAYVDSGHYCYAFVDDLGHVKSTGIHASDSAVRPSNHAKFLTDFSAIEKPLLAHRRKASAPAKVSKDIGKLSTSFPTTGEARVLIILADYTDCAFRSFYTTSAEQYFTDLLSKPGFSDYTATGSVADYFRDASADKFQPKFDVVGPMHLPHNMSYYGGNDEYDNDTRPAQMIIDACTLADSSVNFADYDNDGDGCCDNIYVIYAGYSEASMHVANAIWPHAWTITEATGAPIILDGVEIDRYACSSELLSTYVPDGIGTFIHEFSHVLGLPDLYNTVNSEAEYTPGMYSVMDAGSYNNNSRTPPTYSAFERNALGWIELNVLDMQAEISLSNLADANQACLVETNDENEFFVLENRQQVEWDTYIPNHGMLIWHIDYDKKAWDNGTVNNQVLHPRVDIVKSNGDSNVSTLFDEAGWPWPGIDNNTQFTSKSFPRFTDWGGHEINVPITNIKESKAGVISFNVKDGLYYTSVESVMDGEKLNVSVSGLTITVRSNARTISIYNALGTTVATLHTENGIGTFCLPSAGVYIVSDGVNTRKIAMI